MDGTFLKERFGGVLLLATTQDVNHSIYPLAFTVVDGETEIAWDYFFRKLKTFVHDCSEQVFISDHHASIKKGISNNYYQARHGVCMYHLK